MTKDHGLEKRYDMRSNRIHDGSPAVLGQFPFAVHVRMPHADGSYYICTGSLISNDIVVTAAHCIEDADSSMGITIQYGILDWTLAGPNHFQAGCSDYRRHENYSFDYPITSDIGYVRLNRAIDPNDYDGNVDYIPISSTEPEVGDIATFIGWGAMHDGESSSHTLNWGQSNVVSDAEAWATYGRESYVPSEFFCTDSHASTSHSGTCSGDSGGPAVSDYTYDYAYLWGATSFGSGNCEDGYSCFTNVVHFRQWLTDNTGENFGP